MSGYGESERTGGVEVGPEIGTHASTAPAHQPLPPPPTTHHPPPPLLLRGCSLLSCNIHTILNQTFSLLTSHFLLLSKLATDLHLSLFFLFGVVGCVTTLKQVRCVSQPAIKHPRAIPSLFLPSHFTPCFPIQLHQSNHT